MTIEEVLKRWEEKFPFKTNEELRSFTEEIIKNLNNYEVHTFFVKVEKPKYLSPGETVEERKKFFEEYRGRIKVVFESLNLKITNDKYPWFVMKINKEQANRLKNEDFIEEIIAEYRLR